MEKTEWNQSTNTHRMLLSFAIPKPCGKPPNPAHQPEEGFAGVNNPAQ